MSNNSFIKDFVRRKFLVSDSSKKFDINLGGNLLFFDVETPNRCNDRICSIGIIVTENGIEVLRDNFLINPECYFDTFNIKLTGISPQKVVNAPKFPEIWQLIKPYFTSSLCVGHNISFDLSVLNKVLTYYDLADNFGPVNYVDTLKKAKEVYALKSCGLEPLCLYLGIDCGLHHNSLDDANSCEQIFWRISEEGAWSNKDISTKWFEATKLRTSQQTLTKSCNELQGILFGLSIDNVITEQELESIHLWMSENQANCKCSGFNEIFSLLEVIVTKGNIEFKDYRQLIELLARNSVHKFASDTAAMHVLKGIIRGILADGRVSSIELENLHKWMNEYSSLKDNYPFNRVYEFIKGVIEDGIVSEEESKAIIAMFKKFIDPLTYITDDEEITFGDLKGKACCFTGICAAGDREELEQKLIDMGAIIVKNVTKKTEILIVGSHGSDAWAYGNYGKKVNKALQMQSQGSTIKIISELKIFS